LRPTGGYVREIEPAYEDGTDRVFRNVGIKNSDAGGITQKKAYSIQDTARV